MCVFFKVFHSLYIYLFFFFFGLEPLVFPLRRQFIYVHYFRLPDFYSPFGVFLETRRVEYNARLANAFWPSKPCYTALRLLRSPSATLSVCQREYSTVSTWNQQRRANISNKPSRIIQKPVISIWNRYMRRRQSRQQQKE
jgi:hypothetical protein